MERMSPAFFIRSIQHGNENGSLYLMAQWGGSPPQIGNDLIQHMIGPIAVGTVANRPAKNHFAQAADYSG